MSEVSTRERQRRRTRRAIVQAAMELLATGVTPSVADIADRADVSRRTVYVYFPTLEQLLLDATLGALTQATVDDVIDSSELPGDAHARVERLARALVRMSRDTLPLGRSLIRLTVEGEPDPGDGTAAPPRRGYRRVEWIEAALAPLREQLDSARFEQLVSGLTLILGWEALIVLRDVRRLTMAEAEEVMVWAAHALLSSAH